MRILIVDDDDDIREVLGLILRAQGYEVDEAVDGQDAITRLCSDRDSPPGLILLDLMMPRLDGEGFMRKLRGMSELSSIPVWIISGHAGAREKAAKLGARGCLLKPIDIDQALAEFRSVAGSAVS